jgi:hypothetical protein
VPAGFSAAARQSGPSRSFVFNGGSACCPHRPQASRARHADERMPTVRVRVALRGFPRAVRRVAWGAGAGTGRCAAWWP